MPDIFDNINAYLIKKQKVGEKTRLEKRDNISLDFLKIAAGNVKRNKENAENYRTSKTTYPTFVA